MWAQVKKFYDFFSLIKTRCTFKNRKKHYTHLRTKLRGDKNPHGRPRIYFCCHPDDFDKYFDSIINEILDIQTNGVICYLSPDEDILNDEDNKNFFSDIKHMNIFVIPITTNFIYKDNRALREDFKFAITNKIPVLPLMQEEYLEEGFNKVCGNLQYLYKNSKDITAIPYEKKLKRFLESTLVSDELAKKVRDAFDAYIFLSYRKIDRKYAQEIMHLIHENDFCRDIAIWYDEFLFPGENFNESIEAAMDKSDLFAMVVTPNINIEANYVMTIEYPAARRKNKKILPIIAKETDERCKC